MTRSYLPGHPRPQWTRAAWENLNGIWGFAFDDANEGEAARWYHDFPEGQSIVVPFTYETAMSGIGEESFHRVVWYRRSFHRDPQGKRLLLNFEGVDYLTKVWINGQLAGSHRGGYTCFSFDITDLLVAGENILTVRVEDADDPMQPRGKQRWMPYSYGCWYVQTTGIWKTVWLEDVPETYVERVKMTPDMDRMALDIQWQIPSPSYRDLTLAIEISFQDVIVATAEFAAPERRGSATVNVATQSLHPWLVKAWSPDEPNLYDIRFTLKQAGADVDEVLSYFGMRSIAIQGDKVLLNNRPLYQKLILDQGYWKDSHLTPPDEDAIQRDIDSILAMGYNGARKHQKIEDGRYAYWCDVKGLLLWCEMPSAYRFGDDMIQAFTSEWLDVVERHYNHPSIIVWTPFNESWGIAQVKRDRKQQQFAQAIYHLTKALDGMRPVVSNDGWEHALTDIITLHDYEESGDVFYARYGGQKEDILGGKAFHDGKRTAFAHGYGYTGQPVIISEYGGSAYSGGATGTWGYGSAVENEEKFLARIKDVTDAIKKLPWICGYCYTQITDVQQEVNGLLDAERQYKADPAAIRSINQGTV